MTVMVDRSDSVQASLARVVQRGGLSAFYAAAAISDRRLGCDERCLSHAFLALVEAGDGVQEFLAGFVCRRLMKG